MINQILSLTVLLSFLSLGLIAEEVSTLPQTQEEESVQEENQLACACKKRKTVPCGPVSTDKEIKSA